MPQGVRVVCYKRLYHSNMIGVVFHTVLKARKSSAGYSSLLMQYFKDTFDYPGVVLTFLLASVPFFLLSLVTLLIEILLVSPPSKSVTKTFNKSS